jgi:L-threonylcarbamoyladenylate synthase
MLTDLRRWTAMKTETYYATSMSAQQCAVEILKAGGLVAFPTDTVYGLAAFPWHPQGVARLYEAKARPLDRPIPLLLSEAGHLTRVATLPEWLRQGFGRIDALFWPGALTLVLPKTDIVPIEISQGPTVALRVPDLELARSFIRTASGVLAVTSANISGQPSPVTAYEVEEQLGGRIELILDGGPCREGIPSTILDCTVYPPRLLRRGAVPRSALEAVLGPIDDTNEE